MIDRELSDLKNISITGWKPCTEECYPVNDTNDVVLIAFYLGMENKWCYYTYNECPYGWNVLCKTIAYWMQIDKPILLNK